MSKHFKLRFSFPSFQLCRLKQPPLLPQTTPPATYRFSPVNAKAFDIAYPNVPEPPPPTPGHHSLFKRRLSNNVVSVDCGCRSRSSRFQYNNVSSENGNKQTSTVPVPEKLEESKLHHRMLYNSPVSDASDVSDTWPVGLPRAQKTKMKDRKKEKKKAKPRAYRSNSSVESNNSFGDDDDEETESLVSSSRSFESSYCYDFVFDNSLEAISEGPVNTDSRRKTTKKNQKVGTGLNHSEETRKAATSGYPKKTSVLRWVGRCAVEGKLKESFAVVKRSDDPYEDFKKSMLEMILEKQMSEAKDLEQLLLCFLSLNSRHHHAAIIDAFTEIWEALFSDTP